MALLVQSRGQHPRLWALLDLLYPGEQGDMAVLGITPPVINRWSCCSGHHARSPIAGFVWWPAGRRELSVGGRSLNRGPAGDLGVKVDLCVSQHTDDVGGIIEPNPLEAATALQAEAVEDRLALFVPPVIGRLSLVPQPARS